MNAHTQRFSLTAPAGTIECALDLPDAAQFAAPRGIALIAHPHPLYGGTMDNKVTQTLARAFVALGYASARMNFRGVGASGGTHDGGAGETDDMALLLAHMRQQVSGRAGGAGRLFLRHLRAGAIAAAPAGGGRTGRAAGAGRRRRRQMGRCRPSRPIPS